MVIKQTHFQIKIQKSEECEKIPTFSIYFSFYQKYCLYYMLRLLHKLPFFQQPSLQLQLQYEHIFIKKYEKNL